MTFKSSAERSRFWNRYYRRNWFTLISNTWFLYTIYNALILESATGCWCHGRADERDGATQWRDAEAVKPQIIPEYQTLWPTSRHKGWQHTNESCDFCDQTSYESRITVSSIIMAHHHCVPIISCIYLRWSFPIDAAPKSTGVVLDELSIAWYPPSWIIRNMVAETVFIRCGGACLCQCGDFNGSVNILKHSPIFPNIPSRIPRFMAGQGHDKSFINGYCCTERIVVQIHTVWPSLDSLKIIFPITVNILKYSPKFQICLGHAFLEWQLHRKSLQMPSSDISRGLQKKLWGPKHGLWVPFRQYSPGGNI